MRGGREDKIPLKVTIFFCFALSNVKKQQQAHTKEVAGTPQKGCLGRGRSPNRSTEVVCTLLAKAWMEAAIWLVSLGL